MRTVVAGILERDGKVEGEETLAEALTREWREELGAEVEVLDEVYRAGLETPVGPFTLVALRLRLLSDDPRPLEHRALAWVAPTDLTRLRLLPSNVPIAAALVAGTQAL